MTGGGVGRGINPLSSFGKPFPTRFPVPATEVQMAREEGVTYIDAGSSRKSIAILGQLASIPSGSPSNGAAVTYATITIPAGLLNINGGVIKITVQARSTAAVAKTVNIAYGGVTVATTNSAGATAQFLLEGYIIRLTQTTQRTKGAAWLALTDGSVPTFNMNFNNTTQDLGTDTNITITSTTTTGTDLVIDSVIAQLFPTGSPE